MYWWWWWWSGAKISDLIMGVWVFFCVHVLHKLRILVMRNANHDEKPSHHVEFWMKIFIQHVCFTVTAFTLQMICRCQHRPKSWGRYLLHTEYFCLSSVGHVMHSQVQKLPFCLISFEWKVYKTTLSSRWYICVDHCPFEVWESLSIRREGGRQPFLRQKHGRPCLLCRLHWLLSELQAASSFIGTCRNPSWLWTREAWHGQARRGGLMDTGSTAVHTVHRQPGLLCLAFPSIYGFWPGAAVALECMDSLGCTGNSSGQAEIDKCIHGCVQAWKFPGMRWECCGEETNWKLNMSCLCSVSIWNAWVLTMLSLIVNFVCCDSRFLLIMLT